MFMVKFSPNALNFGYDFVLLVHFFGTPCILLHWALWQGKNTLLCRLKLTKLVHVLCWYESFMQLWKKVVHVCEYLCKHVKTIQACATPLPGHGSLCTWHQVCGGISFWGKHIAREIDAGKYCQISIESEKNQSKGPLYQIEKNCVTQI